MSLLTAGVPRHHVSRPMLIHHRRTPRLTDLAATSLAFAQRKTERARSTLALLEQLISNERSCSFRLLKKADISLDILWADCRTYSTLLKSRCEIKCLRNVVAQAFTFANSRAKGPALRSNDVWVD